MKIYFWRSAEPNFGDDLNEWLWPDLLGKAVGEDDNVLFVGIGSIIGTDLPKADRYIVMGAGAAYSSLPEGFGGPNWSIYGVRGPLTAALCGLDDSKILADPAIILPRVFKPAGTADGKVRFVPHYHSAMRAPWGRICEKAGVELLDPRQESKHVISKIAGSRLILAESMHAAIIADAYRVPWIPVWSSREISSFKWHDWALAVGAHVSPHLIPAPSPLGWLDNAAAPCVANDNSLFPTLEGGEQSAVVARAVAELNDEMEKRKGFWPAFRRRNYLRFRKRVAAPLLNATGKSWAVRQEDATADALRNLAGLEGSLSDENLFRQAESRLESAIAALIEDRKTRRYDK